MTISSDASWRKSSYSMSNGHCIEVAAGSLWVKSSLSFSNGNCVEVAPCSCRHRDVLVRDSKLGSTSPVLKFAATEWSRFMARITGPTK